ncbi:MAG: DUF4870 domain-containing protein [Lentisphaerae bacterium]|nr:DUF4870 domain-containing protein [Lentisphaerota bacterium]
MNTTSEPSVPPTIPLSPADERNWAMGCHLSTFAGYLVPIPFANVFAPLILWHIKRAASPFVDAHGKEALNFQISMTIYVLASVPLVFLCGIGVVLILGLSIADAIFTIVAAITASSGKPYRYPLCIRFVH